ncbi:MAG: isoprenylcysteine carboxylmethyltransferase family protein [Betaproteobacteria bacterium]|nr:isoprenylcysteine carboxylmethyltransferase family protein [Betaproteobacteria bacterium]MDH5212177.1 isoprenylcysteine carboxylmethyltransferase family protein [Betaproteobacteria bacterium]MDH5579766.1 isoprenylcysteine carboxylmethyltransferase family protein [Betaproteobacteria bacterium]
MLHPARYFATHRLLVSRLFAVTFILTVLAAESAHEGNLLSTALFLVGLVLVGIATVGRLWCSLYISGHKNESLITTGPYSVTRNPLYFFSLLGFAGIGFASETFTLGIVLAIAMLVGYPAVIRQEEAVLRERFCAAFEAYCARVPRFLPKLSGYVEPESYTVNPRLFRRSMFDVVWFIWFVGIVEVVEALHEYHYVKPLIHLF